MWKWMVGGSEGGRDPGRVVGCGCGPVIVHYGWSLKGTHKVRGGCRAAADDGLCSTGR